MGLDLIWIAFITGNSSLEPLLEGLLAQIHVNLSWRVFGRNRTGDLRKTRFLKCCALDHWDKVTDKSPKISQDPLSLSLSLSLFSTLTRVLSLPLSHSLHTFLSHARLLAGLLQSHAPAPLSDFLSINVSFFLPSLSQALFFVFRVSVFLSFALSFAVSLPVANTRSRLGHWNCFVQNCLSRNTKHPERKANTCQSQKKRTW